MSLSDEHLENALAEYNDKVDALEKNGDTEELFEALVNRSTILMLMEYYTSCMTDVEDALEIAEEMRKEGKEPDTGSMVKLYENRGQLSYGEHDEVMISDYSKIVRELNNLNENSRHYSKKGILEMCIGCAGDLVDGGYFENSIPFIDHALKMLAGEYDNWSVNCRIELLNLLGQTRNNMGMKDEALEAFTECIITAEPLYRRKLLTDDMEFVLALVYRGDIEEAKGDKDSMISDHEAAAEILDQLHEENKVEDVEMLVGLHQSLASALIERGDMEKAEKHLIRVVKLGLPGMKDAMDELGMTNNDH